MIRLYFKKTICIILAAVFFLSSLTSGSVSFAQTFSNPAVYLTQTFNPILIKGLTIHPDNPLEFDFIIHPGDQSVPTEEFKNESQKLIKYFLAALTVPEKDMWVNLSPVEKDRIVPEKFGQTEMGRDLLAQDYFLKKLTASLISPDNETGKKMWEKIYAQAKEKFGTADIPTDFLSKVWIVPESAKIYENGKSVFVVDAHLKVLMEEDYLVSREPYLVSRKESSRDTSHELRDTSNQIIKQILIPVIEHEVNTGETFANLRQIYNSVILATWYKKNLKTSLLGKVYVDKDKTKGVDHNNPKAKEEIYQKYLEAFQKGMDSIKEEYDPTTQEVVTRKYISGGMDLAQLGEKVEETNAAGLADQLIGAEKVQAHLGKAAVNAAITADAKEEALKKDIEKIILEKGGSLSYSELRDELTRKKEGEKISDKRFEKALLRHFRTMPKTIIHEHVSGVIFPEDLIRYFLDDEPLLERNFSSAELIVRKKSRQEARRRFVLTLTSPRSGIDLQANPVNPNELSQADADRAFRNILFEGIQNLPEDLELTYDAFVKQGIAEQVVNNLKKFVTYKERNVDWNKFERTFAVIKTVTDSHPRFRYELLRKGVLKHFTQDNVNNLELTDFHSRYLGPLIKELVSIEDELDGKMTISVLKAFRKDYLERVISQAEKNAEYKQRIFQPYQGRSLDEVKKMILDATIAMDEHYFKLDQNKIKKEFEEALVQIEDNLRLEKGDQITTEDLRIRLIYAFEARKLALKEAKDFEGDLNQLELQDPLLRKRIGGISSVGIETGYINWIGSPILRNARRIGLKISSHMGEVWEPGKNVMSLKRIKNEIEIGVNRLAHVTVLGLDYGKSTKTRISSELDRAEAQRLQEEIFTLIRRNNIHVELQPTSQVVTSAEFNEYKDHIITKFFEMNEGQKKISFSINTDDSSVFDVSPSEEELEIWKANPNISYSVFSQLRMMANNARFYESPKRVKERFADEREKVQKAIKEFNQYRRRLAVVVFGSARIPDGGEQQKIADQIAELAWTYRVAVKTGGGPSVMKWVLAEFVRLRDEHYSELRRQGEPIPRKFSVQSINILLNSFEPANDFLEQNFDFRHFVFRKMGLYSNSYGFVALHGGLGTIDEIFEAWRRDRRVSTVGTEFYRPFFDVLRDRWTAAGMADRIYYWPLVTDDTQKAFDHVLQDKQIIDKNIKIVNPTDQDANAAIEEMQNGVDKLSKLPRAVVVLGKPEDNSYGQNLLAQLDDVISPILRMNVPVRVASRGLVLDSVLKQAQTLGAELNLQAVLNHREDGDALDANEQYLQSRLPERTLILEDDSNHQLLLTYDARGYVVLPGGIGTLNKLFDLVVAMQTKSIRRKPIVLIGRDFWQPILNVLKDKMENYQAKKVLEDGTIVYQSVPTISPGDLDLMTIVDKPEEAMEELALNGLNRKADDAMAASSSSAMPVLKSKDAMLKLLPGLIASELEKTKLLTSNEIQMVKNFIDTNKEIYKALELLNYNYHDLSHSLAVAFAQLLLIRGEKNLTARDVKVSFLAALLHDFHIRERNKDGDLETGTPAYAPETIRQLKRILGLETGDPQERRFLQFLDEDKARTDPLLKKFAQQIREFIGEKDFDDAFNEIEAMIWRTHNAFDVPFAKGDYVAKAKTIRRFFIEGKIKQTEPADLERIVIREFERLAQDVDLNGTLTVSDRDISKTWLVRQRNVELAYLHALVKVKRSRQVRINNLANILENGSDKSGNTFLTDPELMRSEILPGLIREKPGVTINGTYSGFLKNEVLTDENLRILSRLPTKYKRNLMRQVRFFAALSSSQDLKDWITVQSKRVRKKLGLDRAMKAEEETRLNPLSFEWLTILREDARDDQVSVVTKQGSKDIFERLQDNRFIDENGYVTDLLMAIVSNYDVDKKYENSILGLEPRYIAVEGKVIKFLKEAYRLQKESPKVSGKAVVADESEIPRIYQTVDQLYWIVEVNGPPQYDGIFVVKLRKSEVNLREGKKRHSVAYDVLVARAEEADYGRGIEQKHYKGYVVPQFDSEGKMLNRLWDIRVRDDRVEKQVPWLPAFLSDLSAKYAGAPFTDENPDLPISFQQAFDSENEKIDLTYLDLDRVLGEYRGLVSQRQALIKLNIKLKKHGFDPIKLAKEIDVIKQGKNAVNIAIMGISEDSLSLLQTGGNYENLNLFLPLDLGETIMMNGHPIIAAKPWVIFRGGKAYLLPNAQFLPVHYFINADLVEGDQELVDRLGVPQPERYGEDVYTEEKDISSMILEEGGVTVPKWKSLIVKFNPKEIINVRRSSSKNVVAFLRPDEDLKKKVIDQLTSFLKDNQLEEAVVKPNSGAQGYGVVFYNASNVEEQAGKLIEYMNKGRNYIIQERILPPLIKAEDGSRLDYNFRVFVSTDDNGKPKAYGKVARVDQDGKAVNLSQSAKPWLLEKIGKELGLSADEYRQLEQAIDESSAKALQAVNDAMIRDGVMKPGENSSDHFGADIIVRKEGDKFVAYVIEVNDSASGAMWDLDQALKEQGPAFMTSDEIQARLGEANRGYIETAIRRGMEYKKSTEDFAMKAERKIDEPIDGKELVFDDEMDEIDENAKYASLTYKGKQLEVPVIHVAPNAIIFDLGKSVLRIELEETWRDESHIKSLNGMLRALGRTGASPKIISMGLTANKRIFVQVEKVHGENLSSYLAQQQRPFNDAELTLIAKAILKLIRNGIYFDDLVPENFMYGYRDGAKRKNKQIYLTDLGIDGLEPMDPREAITEYINYYNTMYGLGEVGGWALSDPQKKILNFLKKLQKDYRRLGKKALQNPGGIDLNPSKIHFDQTGMKTEFNLPSSDELIQEYLNIEGFEPIIINITPITNIPLLLGTAEPVLEDRQLSKI